MAAWFGAGMQTDAFNVAFRVPNLLRDLFAEGALSAAFVPTFTAADHREGRQRAWRLLSIDAEDVEIVCMRLPLPEVQKGILTATWTAQAGQFPYPQQTT